MYQSTREGTKKVMVALGVALFRMGTLTACRKAVATVLDSIGWMDERSKAGVRRTAEDTARLGLLVDKSALSKWCATHLYEVMKSFNRAYRATWKKTKEMSVESGLKLRRDMERPIVFYLVSSHQKPQPAHASLQGKVLIDRRWRSVVSVEDRKLIGSYLRKHKTLTVQQAMTAPYWLLVRPNCAHYLIPLKTDDVVGMSLRALNRSKQRKPTHIHRPITDAQRRVACKELQRLVHDALEARIGIKKPSLG